jgi:hypothetical protein
MIFNFFLIFIKFYFLLMAAFQICIRSKASWLFSWYSSIKAIFLGKRT